MSTCLGEQDQLGQGTQCSVVGFIFPEAQMWRPVPKSCTLVTSQNIRVRGPHPSVIMQNAMGTPSHEHHM